MRLCLNPCFSGRWFRSEAQQGFSEESGRVLILVLVEDGFGVVADSWHIANGQVLILVLVEDGFGVVKDENTGGFVVGS